MSNNKKKLIDDAKRVLQECARIQTLIKDGHVKDIPPRDFLATIPHPNGSGSMVCGADALKIIDNFAEIASQRGALTNKISRPVIFKETKTIFAHRFIKENREINTQQLDRFINTVIKSCNKHISSRTHLIPCHLMRARDPDSFTLGPVTFHNKRSITKLIKSKKKPANKTDHQGRYERDLLARALRYYRKFGWVAEVRIDGCDRDMSTTLATTAVTSSLDCLHLLLGMRNTSKMQIGGFDIIGDRRAHITITSEEMLAPSISFSYLGEVVFQDGWSEILTTSDFEYYKNLFDVALETTTSPDLNRPLSRRFLDAAQWYGEAVRDTSLATRTIKFITALERILTTDERNDISSLIAARVAALCFCPTITRKDWEKRAKAAYELRSNLVHGSISPNSIELVEGALNAAEIAEITLLRAISAFGTSGLKEAGINSKRLSNWYRELIVWAEKTEPH